MARLWIVLMFFMGVWVSDIAAVQNGCSKVRMDVVLLMDISYSIDNGELESMRRVIMNLIDKFDIGADATRIGAVTFWADKEITLQLAEGIDKDFVQRRDLFNRPKNITNFPKGTRTNLALDAALGMFRETKRHVQKIAIVCTDGKTTEEMKTEKAAKRLQKRANVIAIGVGANANRKELQMIASGEGQFNVFQADTFDQLEKKLHGITKTACTAAVPSETGGMLGAQSIDEPPAKCPQPCLKNGLVSGQPFANMEMTFQCDPGYSLIGASSATCRQDGTWSKSIPTCQRMPKKCAFLGGIRGGTVIRTRDHTEHGSTVEYTCDSEARFKVDGPKTNKCQDDGTWEHGDTRCKSTRCPVFQGMPSGRITSQDAKEGGTVSFDCDENYAREGPKRLTCTNLQWLDSNGKEWKEIPSCKLKLCFPLLNSFKNGEIRQENGKYIFTCYPGYQKNHEEPLSCDPDTKRWSHDIPKCTRSACRFFADLKNGKYKYDKAMSRRTASCFVNYKLNGPSTHRCEDGKWVGEEQTCVEDMCPYFVSLRNGIMVTQDFSRTKGSTLELQCSVGYQTRDPLTLTCQQNGEWSSDLPKCRGIKKAVKHKRCSAIISLNGFGKCKGDNLVGSVVECSCDVGYTLNPSTQTTMKCMDNQKWEPKSLPRCQAAQCPPLSGMDGGKIKGFGTLPGTEVEFSCEDGYTLRGLTRSICEMTSDGYKWVPEQPSCVDTRCPSLSGVKFGSASPGGESEGSTRTISCDPGYVVSGTAEVTCRNKNWEPAMPSCVRNTCRPIEFIPHGQVIHDQGIPNFEVGSKIKIKCNDKFMLSPPGSDQFECQPDRNWTRDAKCIYGRCNPIMVFANGYIQGYSEVLGRQITYVCNRGFKIRGTRKTRRMKALCQDDATWSIPKPSCERIKRCPTVCPKKGQAEVFYSSKGDGSVAHFTCPEGMTLQGPETGKCVAGSTNAEWDTATPSCIPDLAEECNSVKQDIVILADESKEVHKTVYAEMIKMIRKIMGAYDLSTTRIKLLMYATGVKTIQEFDQFRTLEEMIDNPQLGVRSPKGEIKKRRTDVALLEASNSFRSISPETARTVILISGGISQKDRRTAKQAKKNIASGINTFVIALGEFGSTQDALAECEIITGARERITTIPQKEMAVRGAKAVAVMTCLTPPGTPAPLSATLFDAKAVIEFDPEDAKVAEECQGKKMDVMFVVDKSISVDNEELEQERNYVKAMMYTFDLSNTRCGVISFGRTNEYEVQMGKYATREDLKTATLLSDRDKDFRKGTFTNDALMKMLQFFSQQNDPDREAEKVCMLITDGKPTQSMTESLEAVKNNRHIKIYVVIIGTKVDGKEDEQIMKDISSENKIHKLQNFGKISLKELTDIARSAC